MDKRRITSIITESAKLYHENLEDKKILFVYAVPSEIYKQLDSSHYSGLEMSFYEVAFHSSNFLHLTSVKVNERSVKSAKHFYQKCIDGRLTDDDYVTSKDGSTDQKLSVLKDMMNIRKTASMIGEFSDMGPKLYSEKVAGNIFACIGFVQDKYTGLNVPNTLLRKDIRDITSKPQNKIFAVLSKEYSQKAYSKIDRLDKRIKLSSIKGIENYIDISSLS